jgi:hypothetical protein
MDRNGWTHVVLASAIALVALIVVALFGWWLGWWQRILPRASAQTAGANLLIDGDFEGGFRRIDNARELEVATGWMPWWDARSARPEWKDASVTIDPRRVHGSQHAQQWFNNYAKHTGGVYQRVTGIAPGSTLRLEAWVQAFSSSGDDFSHSNGRYRMRIGIDPYGGIDPESADVAWSSGGNAIQPYDEYQRLEVQTIAKSDRATVFVWGQAEWALKHNDAYVDDVWLSVVGGEIPTPTPGPEPPTPTPGPGGAVDYDRIRQVVREEIDKTRLGQ